MFLNDVYDYFGSPTEVKDKTGITRNAQRRWVANGYIPKESQLRIEEATNGALKASDAPNLKALRAENKQYNFLNPKFVYHHPEFGSCEVIHMYFYNNELRQIDVLTSTGKRLSRFDTTYLLQVSPVFSYSNKTEDIINNNQYKEIL